ncbi:MAG: putative metal-binding motif-containing protein [Candidatus Nanoarchaeia archaeon]|jgi:hypothetical protein
MKKLISAVLILGIVLVTLVYGVDDVDGAVGLSETYTATVITSCSAMGFHHCDIIIGNLIYKIDLKEGRSALGEWITFPSNFPTAGISVYNREQISCVDPNMIAVAKYNEEAGVWVLLPAEDRQPPMEETTQIGAYKIKAPIREPGIYAVVKKDPSVFGELVETEWCVSRECGQYEAYDVIGSSGKINKGEQATFSFCKMLTGCKPSEGLGQCSRQCEQGADPNCPAVCTKDEDCCFPSSDGVCDGDCWKRGLDGNEIIGAPDAGQAVIDSTDPDCIIGDGAEKYMSYTVEDEEKPEEASFTVTRPAWDLMFKEFEKPILAEGKIKLEIDEGKGIWITNFTYTDLWGNEKMLFPLRPSVRGIDWGTRLYLALQPYLLYQHFDVVEGDKVQFDLPPTGIRKISFYAKTRTDDDNVNFKIILTTHASGADDDKDNSTNYEDCNDINPKIYPGAPEKCNKIDDNCNSYNIYNHTPSSGIAISPYDDSELYDSYRWGYSDRLTEGCDGSSRCNIRMPCDGYIQFSSIDDSSYFEIWKRGMELCDCTNDDSSLMKTCKQDNSVSCDAEGANGIWNSYQAVFGYGNDGMYNYEFYADSGDGIGCALGAHASCEVGAFPSTSELNTFGGHAHSIGGDQWLNAYNRFGTKILNQEYCYTLCEQPVDSGDITKMNSRENRIELNESEMLWATTFGCDGTTDSSLSYYCDGGYADVSGDFGNIRFSIFCYNKYNMQDPEGTPANERRWIDEGLEPGSCEIKDKKTVHVCKTSRFDMTLSECADGEYCQFDTETDTGECPYTIPETDGYGPKPFYTYICREEDIGKDEPCYLFYSKSDGFNVCAETENCNQLDASGTFQNVDMDCDGDKPFKEDAEEKALPDQPLDIDCVGQTLHGVCKPETKEWFDSSAGTPPGTGAWKTEGYCQVCGDRDSTCTKSCEAGQKSCDGGCLQDTCDIAAGKWCSAGSWTDAGYCGKCGTIDEDCSSVTCASAACDIVSNHTCYSSRWGDTRGGVAYCDTPCKAKDASCAATCEAGACDTYLNAYCKADSAWSANNAANYCAECGAVDADCGTGTCVDRHCDIDAKKVCDGGLWKDSLTDYCDKCDSVDEVTCLPSCLAPEEWTDTETNCTDGIDNDCSGGADCMDDVCKTLDVCLNACPSFGVTTGCGNNLGICTEGSHTCGMDGRWSECILPPGGRLAETEICNGEWDDDCDGTIDEGCECATGQSRVCGQDSGSCRAGVQRCVDGKWDYCYKSSRASPTTEICDTFDNDCDGEIDEACPCDESSNQTCGGTPGTICKAGLRTCNDGLWGVCAGETKPLTENSNTPGTCTDSIDNDCDGKIDAADDTCSVTPLDQLTPSCNDVKKNQHETGTDCGGECPPCSTPGPATCNNKKMDGDEEGRDCGGSCSISCDEQLRSRTAPSEEDIADDTISEPVCGDAYCDDGETDSCPDDCATTTTSSLSGFLIPGIIILVILGGAFAAYKTGLIKLKGKQQTKQSFPTPKGMQSSSQQSAKPSVSSGAFKTAPKIAQRKEIKSKEELELEKSFKEESELLKK